MKIIEFSKYLQRLESTASRLEITSILAELLKKLDRHEVDKAIYLMLGILAPSYTGVVFNLADRMVIRIVAKAYGASEEEVKKEYKKVGDLGEVAEALSSKSTSSLSVVEVYELLYKAAMDSGEGSQERKVEAVANLLSKLDSLSARYVTRIPVGKLRLGFSDKTVIDALSISEVGDKSLKSEIEKAFNIRPDIGRLAKDIKSQGLKRALSSIKPDIEVPVVPMLPQRLKSPEEMVKKMGLVSVEPKYDGLRIFIHYRRKGFPKKRGGEHILTFTRNMKLIDNSTFPELVDTVFDLGKYINAKEAILDTEAVGMDPKREMLVDFQATMQRRRKHNVAKSAEDVPLQFQVFDILLKDGESLLDKSYKERREILSDTVTNVKGSPLKIDEHEFTDNPDEIRELHKKYLKRGLEGIIIKKVNSRYVSGRTGWRWVKMKEVEAAHGRLADTIDAVIMGYSVGKGRRASFGVGQFLAGVTGGDEIETITKVGTGLTDEQFIELKKRLSKAVVKKKPKEYKVHKDLEPDFWVSPRVVVELAADEITKSPKHTAGFALRFPRLIKFRDDKSPKEATTIRELKSFYKTQRS